MVTFYERREELDDVAEIAPFFEDIALVYLPKWRSVLNCIPALFSDTPLQLAYFKHSKVHKRIQEILSRYRIDIVHTQHLRMSQYTKDLTIPKILDLPDAFSLYFKRRNKTSRPLINRLIDAIEIKRLAKAEHVTKQYNLALVCSVEDRNYLKKLHQINNIDILLNGVDLDTFDVGDGHDYSHSKTLLFTGNMDYAPNVDAVVYFTKEIWPSIKAKHPALTFIIAGQRPVDEVLKLQAKDVMVTGFVKDIADVYKKASVVVAPLRFGAGTQNKVIEAMAMGVPVVCTHIGFAGLQIKSGEGVILAQKTTEFIDQVNTLLSDTNLRENVGQKGLTIARQRFSWDSIAAKLESYLIEFSD